MLLLPQQRENLGFKPMALQAALLFARLAALFLRPSSILWEVSVMSASLTILYLSNTAAGRSSANRRP
jgi:hypothetical protein